MTAKISKMHQRVIDAQNGVNLKDLQNIDDMAEIAKKNPNDFWDDANKQYVAASKGLDQVCQIVQALSTELAAHPEAIHHLADPAATVADCRIVGDDIERHREVLQTIHNQHKDRTGSVTTPDELEQYYRTLNAYSQAAQLFSNNVVVSARRLSDDLGKALDLAHAAKASTAVEDAVIVAPTLDDAIEQTLNAIPVQAAMTAACADTKSA